VSAKTGSREKARQAAKRRGRAENSAPRAVITVSAAVNPATTRLAAAASPEPITARETKTKTAAPGRKPNHAEPAEIHPQMSAREN